MGKVVLPAAPGCVGETVFESAVEVLFQTVVREAGASRIDDLSVARRTAGTS